MKSHYDYILTRCTALTLLHSGQTGNYFGYTPQDGGLLDTDKAIRRKRLGTKRLRKGVTVRTSAL